MAITSERPTVPPAFDVDEYAKESDSGLASAPPVIRLDPSSEIRRVDPSWEETWLRCTFGNVVVAMVGERLLELPLDHRAGFLVSRIDGTFDLATLVEISGMPRGDAIALARELYDLGVIDFQ